MKYLATLFLIFGFGLSGFGQTIKSLGYNTTNGLVVANTTNALTFTNETRFGGGDIIIQSPSISWAGGNYGIHLEEAYLYFDGQEKLRWREEDIEISVPFSFSGTNTAPSTRTNLGLGWSALINTNAATSLLGFTTNGQVVANTGTNVLTFINRVNFDNGNLWLLNGSVIGNAATLDVSNAELLDGEQNIIFSFTTNAVNFFAPISFATGIGATTRANLGFSTNLNTLWTATNASNARSAVGLGWSALTNTSAQQFRNALEIGETNVVYFQEVGVGPNDYTISGTSVNILSNRGFAFNQAGIPFLTISNLTGTNGGALIFHGAVGAATTRTNVGLGGGITATNTFVSYNGTNYTTNTVTISNGIITGWTQ